MHHRSLTWRTSSYSSAGGTCVEVARSPDGRVLVRNSNHPDAGTLSVSAVQMGAWMAGLDNATTA